MPRTPIDVNEFFNQQAESKLIRIKLETMSKTKDNLEQEQRFKEAEFGQSIEAKEESISTPMQAYELLARLRCLTLAGYEGEGQYSFIGNKEAWNLVDYEEGKILGLEHA